MTRLELIGNGSNSVSNATLIGREVLEVSVDGFGRSRIKTTGSPVGQEVIYDSAVGSLTFEQDLETGTQIFVLYQNA